MKWKKLSLAAIAILTLTIAGWAARRFLPLGPFLTAKALCSGRFHQVAHKGRGIATIYQLPDGRRILSLSKFQTAAGAELQVYLIAAADAYENETVESAGFVSLGALQSAEGDQTYPLPADLDLTKYRAVTIWSRKYRVNFTTAPLCGPPPHSGADKDAAHDLYPGSPADYSLSWTDIRWKASRPGTPLRPTSAEESFMSSLTTP